MLHPISYVPKIEHHRFSPAVLALRASLVLTDDSGRFSIFGTSEIWLHIQILEGRGIRIQSSIKRNIWLDLGDDLYNKTIQGKGTHFFPLPLPFPFFGHFFPLPLSLPFPWAKQNSFAVALFSAKQRAKQGKENPVALFFKSLVLTMLKKTASKIWYSSLKPLMRKKNETLKFVKKKWK